MKPLHNTVRRNMWNQFWYYVCGAVDQHVEDYIGLGIYHTLDNMLDTLTLIYDANSGSL